MFSLAPSYLQMLAAEHGWRTLCYRSDSPEILPTFSDDPSDPGTRWEFCAFRPRTRIEAVMFSNNKNQWRCVWCVLRARPVFCKSQFWEELVLMDCVATLTHIGSASAVDRMLRDAEDQLLAISKADVRLQKCIGVRDCSDGPGHVF